jgi:hypothetical protein
MHADVQAAVIVTLTLQHTLHTGKNLVRTHDCRTTVPCFQAGSSVPLTRLFVLLLPLLLLLLSGSGPAMRICGLNSSERQLFMSVLMHFGPPFIHRQPDLGWAPYEQHLTGKTRSQVRRLLDPVGTQCFAAQPITTSQRFMP